MKTQEERMQDVFKIINGMLKKRQEGKCPICGRKGPFQFRDDLSRREYQISGMCQRCQDKAFSGEE